MNEGLIAVVVFWCVSSAPIDSYNPHQLGAVQKFVKANPATCHVQQGDILDVPNLTVATCRQRQMIAYMPGWLQKNEGKLYLGADCIPYRPEHVEPLDLQALKERVTP